MFFRPSAKIKTGNLDFYFFSSFGKNTVAGLVNQKIKNKWPKCCLNVISKIFNPVNMIFLLICYTCIICLYLTNTSKSCVLILQGILGDFSKEQETFLTDRREKERRSEAGVPPWVGYNEEEEMKKQILALSQVLMYLLVVNLFSYHRY